MAATNELLNYIKNKILHAGPITFATFMEIALYHEQWGYYTENARLGRHGDFYTSPHVNPVFGKMLARQLHEMWVAAGQPGHWTVVEYGPGEGILARDILDSTRREFPQFYKLFRYRFLETSKSLAQRQKKVFEKSEHQDAGVKWIKDLNEINRGAFQGCILSNELIDSFPVHLVKQSREGLKELYVTLYKGELALEPGKPSTGELKDYFTRQKVELHAGQRAEVNLNAIKWLNHVVQFLSRGFILTIDYGTFAEELYAPARFDGTLRCFSRHRLKTSPLKDPGKQDITASVNFTALEKWGCDAGLSTLGIISQSQFLINLGILDELKTDHEFSYDRERMKKTMAVKQLIMPEGLGQTFKVLIQCKGFTHLPELSGARSGRGI